MSVWAIYFDTENYALADYNVNIMLKIEVVDPYSKQGLPY